MENMSSSDRFLLRPTGGNKKHLNQMEEKSEGCLACPKSIEKLSLPECIGQKKVLVATKMGH